MALKGSLTLITGCFSAATLVSSEIQERLSSKRPLKRGSLKRWPETDLNRRHVNFQSTALPTELSGLYLHHLFRRTGSKSAPARFDNRKISLKRIFSASISNFSQVSLQKYFPCLRSFARTDDSTLFKNVHHARSSGVA